MTPGQPARVRFLINSQLLALPMAVASLVLSCAATAQENINGRVLGGGEPIANSTVTLYAASAEAPRQLAQSHSDASGRFTVNVPGAGGKDSTLYLVAEGGKAAADKSGADNPAIKLLTVLGQQAPATVTINEMTTVASVWTHNQFIDGTAIKGQPLQLKIAAGNVPSFVDLQTGGWGGTIQDPLNSGQTPTMANFATLANALSGCVTRVTPDACGKLFAASTRAQGRRARPTRCPPRNRLRRLLVQAGAGLRVARRSIRSAGKTMRAVPYMPYLQFAPSAWVLPLKFDGGGYRAGGKAMFDAEGNLWVGNNFTIGWQASDALWQGNASKFDPNGKPLSPITTGFTGGGMEGGTFGAAIDLKGNVWLSSYGSKSIAVFDKDGKPLTPPDGINFGGRLGLMQGIITAPNGDMWALGVSKRQLLHFPKGDWNNGRIVCEGDSAEPCKSFTAPFHLAIDQQDRIWVSDSSFHVIRFPAADPSQGGEVRCEIQQQRAQHRQQGQCLGDEPLRCRIARHGAHGRYGGTPENGRRALGLGLPDQDHVGAEGRQRQHHAAAA